MFEKLIIQNFRSHEKTEICLQSGLNVFLGEVGAGKTSILEALSFSLFGKPSTSLTKTELIKRGSKQAELSLVFIVGLEKYKIERSIFLKKPQKAKLWIYKNNNWKLAVDGSNAVSRSIEKIFGVDSATFLTAMYASQGKIKEMLQTQPGKRREQFDKLLGIDYYEKLWHTMGQSKNLVEGELIENQKIADGYELLTEQKKVTTENIKNKKNELKSLQATLKNLERDIPPKKAQLEIFSKLKTELDSIKTKKDGNIDNINNSKKTIESLKDSILKNKEAGSVYKENSKYLKKEDEIRKEKDRIAQEIQKKCNTQKLLDNDMIFLNEKNQEKSGLEEQLEKLPNLKKELKNLEKKKNQKSNLESEKQIKQNKFVNANNEFIKYGQKNEAEIKKIKRITELGECPTCLQNVPEDHKIRIKIVTIQKQDEIKKEIEKWEKIKLQNEEEINSINTELEKSRKAAEEFGIVNTKIENLEKKQKELERVKKGISSIQDKINKLNWDLSGIKETDKDLKEIEIEFSNVSKGAKLAREALLKLASKKDLEKHVLNEKKNLKTLQEKNSKLKNTYALISKKYKIKDHKKLENEIDDLKEKRATTNEGINRVIKDFKEYENSIKEIIKNINEKREAKEKTEILESELKVLNIVRKALRDILQPVVRKNSVMNVSEEFQQFYQALSNDMIDHAAIDENGNVEVIRNGERSPINTLSGGETTTAALALRLSICSSLTKNQLLLLDEPTIHLDEVYRAKLKDFLEKYDFDQLIVVTHDNTFESLPAQIFLVEKKMGNSIITALKKGE